MTLFFVWLDKMSFQVYGLTDNRAYKIKDVYGTCIKLGKSCVTHLRINTISGQESFVNKGTLCLLITLDSEKDMNELEIKLHQRFKDKCCGKEWFVVEPDDVIKYVKEFAKDHNNVMYETDVNKLSLIVSPLKLRMDDHIIIGRDVSTTKAKRTIKERISKLHSLLTTSPYTTPSKLLGITYEHYKDNNTSTTKLYTLEDFKYDYKYGYFKFT